MWDAAPDYPASAKAVTPATVTGYWAVGSDGKVYKFGDAPEMGSPSAGVPMVDVEASRFGKGYWTLDEKGVVAAFGPVRYGSVAAADLKVGERATSLSGTPTGSGYWVFTNRGRVFAFGDAGKSIGDVSTIKLNGEILDSAATPSGKGYYMVGSDGGVFTLGDAHYEGSMGGVVLGPLDFDVSTSRYRRTVTAERRSAACPRGAVLGAHQARPGRDERAPQMSDESLRPRRRYR